LHKDMEICGRGRGRKNCVLYGGKSAKNSGN